MQVLVALGCRVGLDAHGRLTGALARRIGAAANEYARRRDRGDAPLVVVSGGRRWGQDVEADAMAAELRARGVPAEAIVRERCSLSTRENARFVAALLQRRGLSHATVVTSAFHLPRALRLFRAAGLEVDGVSAPEPPHTPTRQRLWLWSRERFLRWVQAPR